MTLPDGRPMGARLTGRRCRRSLPKGSELGLERWPGSGARGRRRRRRRHQRVGSRGGRSRSGGRSRGCSGGGACELPRVARAGTPRTLGGSASGGLSRRRPSSPRPQAQTAGLGSPEARDWLLSGQALQAGLWVFLGLWLPSDSGRRPEDGDHLRLRHFLCRGCSGWEPPPAAF